MRYWRDILGNSVRHAGQIKAWPSVPFSTKVNEKLLAIPTAVLLRRCPSRSAPFSPFRPLCFLYLGRPSFYGHFIFPVQRWLSEK